MQKSYQQAAQETEEEKVRGLSYKSKKAPAHPCLIHVLTLIHTFQKPYPSRTHSHTIPAPPLRPLRPPCAPLFPPLPSSPPSLRPPSHRTQPNLAWKRPEQIRNLGNDDATAPVQVFNGPPQPNDVGQVRSRPLSRP